MQIQGRIIKHIATKTYEIAMYELPNGTFLVGYQVLGAVVMGQPVTDFNMAAFLFEQKQRDLEGH